VTKIYSLKFKGQVQRFMSVIPGIQENEIQSVMVQGQPREKFGETPF
jgi:hypothetical protein